MVITASRRRYRRRGMRSTKNSCSRAETVCRATTIGVGNRFVCRPRAVRSPALLSPRPARYGLCNAHLSRRRRTGDPGTRRALPRNSLLARARRPARAIATDRRRGGTIIRIRRENHTIRSVRLFIKYTHDLRVHEKYSHDRRDFFRLPNFRAFVGRSR